MCVESGADVSDKFWERKVIAIMKTEELLELGLSREQVGQVLAINGRDIERTKESNAQQRMELEELKKGLAERENELAQYRELDVEALKTEAKDWREKAEKAEKEGKEKLDKWRVQQELQRICRESGARDAKVLDALIDRDAVSIDGETVCGLSEQVEKLKSEYGFLFEAEDEPPYFSQKMSGFAEDENSILRKAMGI